MPRLRRYAEPSHLKTSTQPRTSKESAIAAMIASRIIAITKKTNSALPGIGAIMPVPGNAEMVVYILATILVAIIALASDEVNSGFFVDYFKWATAAYLVSRGIAKASRVLER